MKEEQKSVSNPLGKKVDYICDYQPDLLFPILRLEKRLELKISNSLPFNGEDIWNAYELSWLDLNGVPQVAIGNFVFPADSPSIIESKSFKLYLNSFNQTKFESVESVQALLIQDLTKAVQADVKVTVSRLDEPGIGQVVELAADCIDHQEIVIESYDYRPELLSLEDEKLIVEEKLISHLLKSNCLITNQPDWASVLIEYKGQKISHQSLLKYLVSFRTHNEFHEQCVERIYVDIMRFCQPKELTVYARYTRRGGLDINPWRSNCLTKMKNIRLVRQ